LKTKLALIAISVILLVSLAANGYFFTLRNGMDQNLSLKKEVTDLQTQLANLKEQTNLLQNEKASLETQAADLQSQEANLSNQTDNLQAENAYLQTENADLENQLSHIPVPKTAPKILTRLGPSDVRSSPFEGHPWSGVIRFYISGEVWNVGTADAHDCRLHVTLYQVDAVANDSYIDLGTVEAGSYVEVSSNIYYSGEPLTSWTIIPEYS
jgi:regulator of replication initiation timing